VPHALAIRQLTVAEHERAAYLARLAERRASARASGYNLWTFEGEGARGQFVEFIETRDRGALATALAQDALFAESLDWRHAAASGEGADPAIYLEVESPQEP
jgi:hypothetical protein